MEGSRNKELDWLRIIAWGEGTSFLLILFVSMPLKYIWEMPMANKIIGYVHGVLFILYIITVWLIAEKREWSTRVRVISLVAPLIPFGAFWADRRIFARKVDSGK